MYSSSFSNTFSNFVCRVGGLPTSLFDGLRAEKTLQLIGKLEANEAELFRVRERVSEGLHEIIGQLSDKKQRRLLLNIRRDMFNLRSVSSNRFERALSVIPTTLVDDVQGCQDLLLRRQALLEQIGRCYGEEMGKVRQQFRGQVREDESFQQGVLLSSQPLYGSMGRYLRSKKLKLKRREEKTELSLLRYYARTVMKTTPFSMFCVVVPGRITTHHTPTPTFTNDPGRKSSFVRINKSLYGLLFDHFTKHPEIRQHLEIEPNPTIRQENDRLVLLTAKDNREIFQRMPRHPIFMLVMGFFNEQPHRPLTEIVDLLCADPRVDATPEQALPYINKMLEIGLLRFRTGIRQQDADWDIPFRALLEAIDHEDAQQVVELLTQLRQATELYATASVTEREKQLKQIQETINVALEGLEIPAKAQMPLYEDATADAVLSLPQSLIEAPAGNLARFVNLTTRLSWPRTEQITLRHFFDTYYGASSAPVPLLQFYEEYYREHFKEHLAKQQKIQSRQFDEDVRDYNVSNPFELESVKQLQDTHTQLTEFIREAWAKDPTTDEIHLDLDEVEAIVDAVPPIANTYESVSVFSQFVPRLNSTDAPALVAPKGQYMGGYGKYFSRFLYMFPNDVTETVFKGNDASTEEYVAEICDDAHFNANLHPPLVKWEISYPTGSSGAAENQLASADLFVARDPDNAESLCLLHGTSGKKVYPLDLGFLNPRMRPPLYQLLSRFMPVSGFSIHIPTTTERPPAGNPQTPQPNPDELGILYRPRIIFNNNLILSRRHWRIPSAHFPQRQAQEPDQAYFLRVNRWRRVNKLPHEVFMRIQPRPTQQQPSPPDPDGEADNAAKPKRKPAPPKQLSRDLHKPQYIDFRNPLLVNLFGHAVNNLDRFVVNLEERLPGQDDLIGYGDEQYVTEFILQFNYPDETVAPTPETATETDTEIDPTLIPA